MTHLRPLFCLLLATFATSLQAQTRTLSDKGTMLDRVAAVVNEGVVLQSELDDQIESITQRLKQAGQELPPQSVLRQQVLERLVLQEIQMQRAAKGGIRINDEQLNQALADVAGDIGERLVELLVVDADAALGGALHLDFLQHESLEHLLAQYRLRRQFLARLLQALRDRLDLIVQFALQHHAFVDHGGDAIEHRAFVGERAGLRLQTGREGREEQAKERTKMSH